MKYIGIDHHKQYSVVTVMDERGTVVNKGRVPMKRERIREYMTMVKGGEETKAVMEASYGREYLYDVLREVVDEVMLAHPLKTRAIAEARIKHDLLDAQTLAHLLRADLIPPTYAPFSGDSLDQDPPPFPYHAHSPQDRGQKTGSMRSWIATTSRIRNSPSSGINSAKEGEPS